LPRGPSRLRPPLGPIITIRGSYLFSS